MHNKLTEKQEMLFLGNGEHSMLKEYCYHKLLGEAFQHMSGYQQPLPCNEDYDQEALDSFGMQVDSSKLEVLIIANKIYTALTGIKVLDIHNINDLTKHFKKM